MTTRRDLRGRTVVMSGGSRGIGLAIAERLASDGANIVLLAKTSEPHPHLAGTIHTAAERIEAAGGTALPVVGDVRSDADIQRAVDLAVETFGGIDICINNASVLNVAATLDLVPSRYDLMMDVTVRGTFQLTRACLPWLLRSDGADILSLSPPLNLSAHWLGAHPGYTLAKYGMTITTLAIGEEHRARGITATCLWPQTLIGTAAIANVLRGEEALPRTRQPSIMADAAHVILTRRYPTRGGETLIDESVLRAVGVSDFTGYAVDPEAPELDPDLFLDLA